MSELIKPAAGATYPADGQTDCRLFERCAAAPNPSAVYRQVASFGGMSRCMMKSGLDGAAGVMVGQLLRSGQRQSCPAPGAAEAALRTGSCRWALRESLCQP